MKTQINILENNLGFLLKISALILVLAIATLNNAINLEKYFF